MTDEKNDFLQEAQGKRATLVQEMFGFLVENKKWWLTPIVLAVLLLGLFVALSGTAAAPFIYTLF